MAAKWHPGNYLCICGHTRLDHPPLSNNEIIVGHCNHRKATYTNRGTIYDRDCDCLGYVADIEREQERII